MGIIKFGLKMLIKEKKQSISYLIAMIFVTAIMLNNFNIVYNTDFLENDYVDLRILAGIIAMIVLCGGMICIAFANLYFIVGKAKMVSLAMLSGKSASAIGLLLAVQNFVLGFIGIIIGIIVGVSFTPLINILVYSGIGEEIKKFKISSIGILATVIVLLIILAISSLVSLGYTQRNELIELLKERQMKRRMPNKYAAFKASGLFWWITYFIPIICLVLPIPAEDKSTVISFLGIITLVSVRGLVVVSIPQLMEKFKRKHCKYDKIKTIALSNVISILDDTKYVLLYLLCSVEYLIIKYLDIWSTDKVRVVIAASYVAIVIISSICMLYKVLFGGINKRDSFKQLILIGYTRKQIGKIISLEISLFYIIIVMIPFMHILPMLSVTLFAQSIPSTLTLIMIMTFIILFSITYIIALRGCKRIVSITLDGGV